MAPFFSIDRIDMIQSAIGWFNRVLPKTELYIGYLSAIIVIGAIFLPTNFNFRCKKSCKYEKTLLYGKNGVFFHTVNLWCSKADFCNLMVMFFIPVYPNRPEIGTVMLLAPFFFEKNHFFGFFSSKIDHSYTKIGAIPFQMIFWTFKSYQKDYWSFGAILLL